MDKKRNGKGGEGSETSPQKVGKKEVHLWWPESVDELGSDHKTAAEQVGDKDRKEQAGIAMSVELDKRKAGFSEAEIQWPR